MTPDAAQDLSKSVRRAGDLNLDSGVKRSAVKGTRIGLIRAPKPTVAAKRLFASFLRHVALSDVVTVFGSVFVAQSLRFFELGETGLPLSLAGSNVSYTAFSATLSLSWLLMLRLHGAYSPRLVRHGADEYKVIVAASFRLFALVAIASYIAKVQVARGYVAFALPIGVAALLLSRWMWRKRLAHHRSNGRMSGSVVVVGDRDSLETMIRSFRAVPSAGLRVVAACCSDGRGPTVAGVPVLGAETEGAAVAQRLGVDTVACSASARLGSSGLRRLGWSLEGLNIDLIVAPGLIDVAGPRVRARPVAGLPVLYVEAPVFAGPKLAAKTFMDRAVALVLLVVLSPLFLALASLIVLQDRGPVFFLQDRIGRGGRQFHMFKFRTMVVGAERMLPDLLAEKEQDVVAFAKVKQDPRITRIGHFLRRYSLDELPQLLNVLAGDMSLVGPRPQVQFEVDTYNADVRRRLLVKPGMTGLWQINGRNDLPWDESVRFDLYYVENWSLAGDLLILWRTWHAIFSGRGAY